MKLLGSNRNIIIKDVNGENVPNLEITEVVLVWLPTWFNSLIYMFQINHWSTIRYFTEKFHMFKDLILYI